MGNRGRERPCSPPRSGRRTASSTSSRTRPRTCSTRSGSSAASTPRASEIAADEVAAGRRGRAVHREDRAHRRGVPARSSRGQGRGDQELLRDGGQPAADPGHGAAVHRREAAASSRSSDVRQRRQPAGAARQVPDHRRPAPPGGAALLPASSAPTRRATIHVPCVIFDGKSEDFATEMFVIINSTPTRINKSHLVDLYERVSWAAPDKKLRRAGRRDALQRGRQPAALPDQPPRRPQQAGEVDPAGRAVQRAPPLGRAGLEEDPKQARTCRARPSASTRSCATSSRPPRRSWGEAWGNASYMVTQAGHDQGDAARVRRPRARRRRAGRRPRRSAGSAGSRRGASSARSFRTEGFYERFPAKGQVERVARIHRELARWADIEVKGKALT